MTTTDSLGNLHDGAGRFSEKQHSAPVGLQDIHDPTQRMNALREGMAGPPPGGTKPASGEFSSDATRQVWQRQLDASAEQLKRWVIEIDGGKYLSTDAPRELSDLHSRLTSVGYAKGWLTRPA